MEGWGPGEAVGTGGDGIAREEKARTRFRVPCFDNGRMLGEGCGEEKLVGSSCSDLYVIKHETFSHCF